MSKLSFTSGALGLFLAFSPISYANAESTKSDAQIVQDVSDLMQQMSDAQREAVLKQAAIIEERLRNMSQKERDELINTVRDVGSSIDIKSIKANSLEKVSPTSLDDTMKNLKEYQERY